MNGDNVTDAPRKGWIELLAAATAILLFITAALGLYSVRTASERDTAVQTVEDQSSEVEDLQGELEDSQTTLADTEQELEEANAEIEHLKELIGGPPGTNAPLIHNHADALLLAGDTMDLNSSDPQWGIGETEDTVPSSLNYNEGGFLEFWYVDIAKPDSGQPADYAACSTLTTYVELLGEEREAADMEGTEYCLRLDNRRYGALEVLDYKDEQVTVKVTTWEFK